ncbi:MAG: aminomethyl-transferring glycine dehydrogenase subunit GcvPB, partial [Gammaproteobacteria bacterium]
MAAKKAEPLIFEHSRAGRQAYAQNPGGAVDASGIPAALRRQGLPALPEVSELQAVRHYTRLSQLNFSIDTHFYPLGSCTMKYNPRACNTLAMLPEFLARHPLAPMEHSQGFLACMHELQEMLKAVTGMAGVSLTPMAGAQGEFAGVAMIRAYHRSRNDMARTEILVPDAAHGTNPATATQLGMTVREIPTDDHGDVNIDALKAALGPQTAGIMLTNPSTLGVFERQIKTIARLVHEAGGLLYYDGANLNAILGKVRPGDMGFDVIHMNLHKTFSTPHGGGGPG